MPTIYRKLYIKFINAEIERENEAAKNKGKSKNAPTNDEVLEHMQKAAKLDKDNKTGLNLQSRLDKLKSKDKQNNQSKIDNYYNKDDDE